MNKIDIRKFAENYSASNVVSPLPKSTAVPASSLTSDIAKFIKGKTMKGLTHKNLYSINVSRWLDGHIDSIKKFVHDYFEESFADDKKKEQILSEIVFDDVVVTKSGKKFLKFTAPTSIKRNDMLDIVHTFMNLIKITEKDEDYKIYVSNDVKIGFTETEIGDDDSETTLNLGKLFGFVVFEDIDHMKKEDIKYPKIRYDWKDIPYDVKLRINSEKRSNIPFINRLTNCTGFDFDIVFNRSATIVTFAATDSGYELTRIIAAPSIAPDGTRKLFSTSHYISADKLAESIYGILSEDVASIYREDGLLTKYLENLEAGTSELFAKNSIEESDHIMFTSKDAKKDYEYSQSIGEITSQKTIK